MSTAIAEDRMIFRKTNAHVGRCFLWAMAAHREVEDRQFGVVNVQPGFDQGGSGLETGRAIK